MIFKKIFYYPGPLWMLHSAAASLFNILNCIVMGCFLLLGIMLGISRATQTKIIRVWNFLVLWSYGFKIEVIYKNTKGLSKSSLIASNHQSLLDIPLAFYALPGDIRMVAKKELFSIPIFGACIKRTHFIPIDRGNSTSGRLATETIKERFVSGFHIWVAPEGTRSKTGEVAPFKKGSFAVAIEAQVPVQPIVIVNARDALPAKSLLVRTGLKIKVVVLEPVSTEGLGVDKRAELAEKVRNSIVTEINLQNSPRG